MVEEAEGGGMGSGQCAVYCSVHCTVLYCPVIVMVITPLSTIHPFSPLCMAMCRFNSDWEGMGGRDGGCVHGANV